MSAGTHSGTSSVVLQFLFVIRENLCLVVHNGGDVGNKVDEWTESEDATRQKVAAKQQSDREKQAHTRMSPPEAPVWAADLEGDMRPIAKSTGASVPRLTSRGQLQASSPIVSFCFSVAWSNYRRQLSFSRGHVLRPAMRMCTSQPPRLCAAVFNCCRLLHEEVSSWRKRWTKRAQCKDSGKSNAASTSGHWGWLGQERRTRDWMVRWARMGGFLADKGIFPILFQLCFGGVGRYGACATRRGTVYRFNRLCNRSRVENQKDTKK